MRVWLQHASKIRRLCTPAASQRSVSCHRHSFCLCRGSSPGPEDEAPVHPWSVSNPRFLGTPAASQPTTLTMSAAAAAAPSGQASAAADPHLTTGASPQLPQHMGIGQSPAELSTAIPALLPEPGDAGECVSEGPGLLCNSSLGNRLH